MKKPILTIAFCLLLIFLTIELKAQHNYTVSLKMPPPGTLNVSDFWNVTVTNNSGSEQSGYLTGTAREDKDGMIAKGTTVPILFKKGVNNIKIKDLPKTPDVEYMASDPRYKESLIRQGKFPSGNYEICVKVISAETNEELGSDCINQEVLETGLLSLISPYNGQEKDAKAPLTFTWSAGGNVSAEGYTLQIVEMTEGQSPESAMKFNRKFLKKSGIKTSNFQYPNSAAKFVEGKKYAWMVSSGTVQSEVFGIVLYRYDERKSRYDEQKITLMLPKSNESIKDMKKIKFEWRGKQPKDGFTLIIFEIDEKQYNEIKEKKNVELRIETPLFEVSGIRQNYYSFNDSSVNFRANHHYGWGIRGGTRGGPFSFGFNGNFSGQVPPANELNLSLMILEAECLTDFSWQDNYDGTISFSFLPTDGELTRNYAIAKIPVSKSLIYPSKGSWYLDASCPWFDVLNRQNALFNNNPDFSGYTPGPGWTNPITPIQSVTGVWYDPPTNSVLDIVVVDNIYVGLTRSNQLHGASSYFNDMNYWYIVGIECPGNGGWNTFLLADYGLEYRMMSQSNIILLSPQINEPVKDRNNVKFEWNGNLPKNGFTLSIFEIDEKQYKDMTKNKNVSLKIEKPLFEKSGIRDNQYTLINSPIIFDPKRHYGWGIRGGTRSGGPFIFNYNGNPQLSTGVYQAFDLHVKVEENIEAWGDDNHDGTNNELEDGYGGQILTGFGNQFVLRWKFNDPLFIDPYLVVPFVVKIVTYQQDPVPMGYESPVGSGNWITPTPLTCSGYM